MTTAVEISRGDTVSFTPEPHYHSNLQIIDRQIVVGLIRDDAVTILTFSIYDSRDQVILPNDHPVVIHPHAG